MKINQSFETVPIDSVRPHPQNPRKGNLSAISDSVSQNGFYGTIVVQKSTGYILAGNHRWMAAKALGQAEIHVAYVDVDDDRAVKILLVDNRTGDLAEYDDNALIELLSKVSNEAGLDGTGYSDEDIDALIGELAEGGEESEEKEASPPSAPIECPNCGHMF